MSDLIQCSACGFRGGMYGMRDERTPCLGCGQFTYRRVAEYAGDYDGNKAQAALDRAKLGRQDSNLRPSD